MKKVFGDGNKKIKTPALETEIQMSEAISTLF